MVRMGNQRNVFGLLLFLQINANHRAKRQLRDEEILIQNLINKAINAKEFCIIFLPVQAIFSTVMNLIKTFPKFIASYSKFFLFF